MLHLVKAMPADPQEEHREVRQPFDDAAKEMTDEQRLNALMYCLRPDDESRRLVETFVTIEQFACRLAGFYTGLYPSAEVGYGCLVYEVLDIAATGYLRAEGGRRDSRDCLAIFLANGVAAAGMAHCAFSAEQLSEGGARVWRPWSDGSLANWATVGTPITFKRRPSPSREERYVIRSMLAQRLLRHEDMMSIARAGVDLHSLELF